LWTLAVIVAAALAVTGYEVFGPKPTDFAGGARVALGAYHGADPSGVPAELKSASLIERGEYLTGAADCAVCHTAKDGVPFAGGRAFVLPFGTMYSTNITPDTAYLFSLKPVHAPAIANTFSFPFNQRWLMTFWSAMFDADKRFEPVVERSADWNRGAYLVEAMGHCGECHTPRNLFFALNNRSKFTGAIQAGWRAYNITPDHSSGVGSWSDEDLAHYLAMGHADGRGTAAGPMGEAIDASLSHLKPADIAAIVTYIRSVPGEASADLPEPKQAPSPGLQASDADQGNARGKQVYEGACAGCHGWTGISPVIPFATLTGTRSVNDPTATNVAQVIIAGGQRHYAIDSNNMPAFGSTYTDAEIAGVANYVTARYGAKGSDLTAESIAKLRAAE
jgi:mono/diheme cytochrome c family protein